MMFFALSNSDVMTLFFFLTSWCERGGGRPGIHVPPG